MSALPLLLLVVLPIAGCDTGGLAGESREGPRVVRSWPADGEADVPRLTGFRFEFDRRLSPSSVDRSVVEVRSGGRQELLSVRFDPVDRILDARTFSGRPLEPGVVYRLLAEGVRDLDGGELAEPYSASFRTAQELGEPPAEVAAGWPEVSAIFTDACGGTACHGADGPALGLDLSSADAVLRTAVGTLARQTETGTLGAEPGSVGAGLSGMPIIDAGVDRGSPSHSYLIYKMLGDEHALGEPMPPDGVLNLEVIQMVSSWILDGAPVE